MAHADRSETPTAILLVDDDMQVRRVLAEQLESLGYAVLPAETAAEALTILRRGDAIDLLFTDMSLPAGMNGLELAQVARALRPALKVLYCSGCPSEAITREAREDSAVGLLAKPFRRADLVRAVRGVLDGHGS